MFRLMIQFFVLALFALGMFGCVVHSQGGHPRHGAPVVIVNEDRDKEALKNMQEMEREEMKHQQEMEREEMKHQQEMQKKWEEKNREEQKRWEEMERERLQKEREFYEN